MCSHHSLVNNWVSASLADDEIRPLYDDNRHKEGRVTGVLKHLPLSVRLQKENNIDNIEVRQIISLLVSER